MIRLAWRNLYRNKKRTVITLISVFFAAMLISFTRFLSYGSHQETIWNAVQMQSGYIQLAAPAYMENPSIENAMDIHTEDFAKLRVEGVTSVSPRIVGFGLAAFENRSKIIQIFGADPEKEKQITIIHKKVVEGEWLKSDSIGCVIGQVLADKLKIKPGDTLSVITAQFDGSIGALNLQVTGLFKTDDYEIDSRSVYVTLDTAQELFRLTPENSDFERFTSVAIGIDRSQKADEIFERIRELFPGPPASAKGTEAEFQPKAFFWPDLIPGVVELMNLDQASGELTLSFLILIMAFGILNTVQMSVYERKKEFGVLMAIGTKASGLMTMVFFETVYLLGIGLVLGLGAGTAISYYFQVHPIVLGGDLGKGMVEMGFVPILRCIIDMRELGIAIITLTLPVFIFVLFVIRKIAAIRPAEVIREA